MPVSQGILQSWGEQAADMVRGGRYYPVACPDPVDCHREGQASLPLSLVGRVRFPWSRRQPSSLVVVVVAIVVCLVLGIESKASALNYILSF